MKVTITPAGAHYRNAIKSVTLDDGESVRALKYVGESSRAVWGDDELVVKLEMPERNILQTAGECAIWETLDEDDRPHFAPLLGHGIVDNDPTVFFTVQAFNKGRRPEWGDTETEVMRALFNKYGMSGDFYMDQFRIREDGTPVAHDYGYLNDRMTGPIEKYKTMYSKQRRERPAAEPAAMLAPAAVVEPVSEPVPPSSEFLGSCITLPLPRWLVMDLRLKAEGKPYYWQRHNGWTSRDKATLYTDEEKAVRGHICTARWVDTLNEEAV